MVEQFKIKTDNNKKAKPTFTHFDFGWCWGYVIKQLFHSILCLISKVFTLDIHTWLTAIFPDRFTVIMKMRFYL